MNFRGLISQPAFPAPLAWEFYCKNSWLYDKSFLEILQDSGLVWF